LGFDIPRWLTHVVVLGIVVTIPALSGVFGGNRPPQTVGIGTVLAASSSQDRAGTASRGFILKPAVSSPAPPVERPKPVTYTVQKGDVLGAIAARYGLRLDTLRQSNGLQSVDSLSIGQQLLIPPTNGVLVKVAPGDTVASLAARYHMDQKPIIEYNLVRDPLHLEPGTLLMLPDGTGLNAPQPTTVETKGGSSHPQSSDAIPFGHSHYNRFPWGQCTYWVASQRDIPWNGNAWEWFGAAQAAGVATGKTPRVGAVMVTWESRYYGHVALVEQVFDDGSWEISEMNYRGLGVVDHRRIRFGQVPLIGFIY
jgi:surface antigen